MATRALAFRALATGEANARLRVGQGLSLAFDLEQQRGSLALCLSARPAPRLAEPGLLLSSSGAFALSDASALLSLLSDCPALLLAGSPPGEDSAWYWQLYNQRLSPELQALFGYLEPTTDVPGDLLDCRLHAHIGGLRVGGTLRLAADTLLGLLDRAPWQPLQRRPDADLPMRIPLTLGSTLLSPRQLEALRPGDIVLVEQPLFDVEGRGVLHLGACRVGLRLDDPRRQRFAITDLEETAMNASIDHLATPTMPTDPFPAVDAAADDADEPQVGDRARHAPEQALERFADLPLALTLRAGTLCMTLAQMRNLGVGSVLTLSDTSPGHALLCHGERPLARGELVDVDGRLGLQITHLETLR